jgi:hypothetical protein
MLAKSAEMDKETLMRQAGYCVSLTDGSKEYLYEAFYQELLKARDIPSIDIYEKHESTIISCL